MRSPKTEHHGGHESRLVPVFPELLRRLRDAFDPAQPGAVYVVEHTRDAGANLRTHLQRIIKRAGLKAWPKLWPNRRATRATELAQTFPEHIAAACRRHAAKIAPDHDRQGAAEHVAAVLQPDEPPVEGSNEAAQNPAQSRAAAARPGGAQTGRTQRKIAG